MEVLAHASQAWNVQVFVPETVLIEAIGGYQRLIDDAIAGLERWADKHTRRTGLNDPSQMTREALSNARSAYPEQLGETLRGLGVTVVATPNVSHRTLVERRPVDSGPVIATGTGTQTHSTG